MKYSIYNKKHIQNNHYTNATKNKLLVKVRFLKEFFKTNIKFQNFNT